MTVPPRGARTRRGGRRPGWLLLTALLVLAILASSTLVFTSSVQLLRLAVILSLWAAVLAAFVSVLYRRQSETDQARARDQKFVYDLQLDREISARREYELGVEAHLRRQMARERGQAAEELIALRAELASLRANLEVLLGAELGDRPAIEADRVAAASLAGAFAMPPPPDRVESSRVTEEVTAIHSREPIEVTEYAVEVTAEIETVAVDGPIIDVPEQPLAPVPVPPVWSRPEQSPPPVNPVDGYRGSHRRGEPPAAPTVVHPAPSVPDEPPVHVPTAPWRPPETRPRRGRHWTPEDGAPAVPPAASPVSQEAADAAAGRHRGSGATAVEEAGEPEESPAQHTGGQSVADLMARLNLNEPPAAGGGRRRRDDEGDEGGGRSRQGDEGGGRRRRDDEGGGGRRRREAEGGGGRRRREE